MTYLELENGQKFTGQSFGAPVNIAGEVVFQTGMVGYPEALTDPSYAGQILVLTYPLVGNYGVPNDDINDIEVDEWGIPLYFESAKIQVAGLIVGEYVDTPSHWNNRQTLSNWLKRWNIPALTDIDTRSLTKLVREEGVLPGRMITSSITNSEEPSDSQPTIPEFVDISQQHLVARVSTRQPKIYRALNVDDEDDVPACGIILVDCGVKYNQIRSFLKRGFCVKVVPWDWDFNKDLTTIEEGIQWDALFLSNGPGDPRQCQTTINHLKQLMERNAARYEDERIPVFGICLGHQIMALAAGGTIQKMKYGNRGHNLPVVYRGFDTETREEYNSTRCLITSQNHGYEVILTETMRNNDWHELFRNANDGSNEGLIYEDGLYFSTQFHPEARAGPEDTDFIFDVFGQMLASRFCGVLGRDSSIRQMFDNGRCNHYRDRRYNHLILGNNIATRDKYPWGATIETTNCKVLILGSGGLSIGQAGEFDYSGSQAIKAYREEGLQTVLINPNIATIQTSKGLADKVYYLPVKPQYIEQVIETERPDYLALSFGGQTALNCGVQLQESGILEKYGVKVLGTPVKSIQMTEDRQAFSKMLAEIGEACAPSQIASTLEEGLTAATQIGFPVLVRAAYALGGLGSGFANDEVELTMLLRKAFATSPQVIIDKSLRGWKELEYEIVRDIDNNCISVCNMENLDPLGVHTGESIVVAPSQTLNDEEYNMLRTAALKIIRRIGVVGECNIQYALDPHTSKYYVIEVNARLSRSSALASKATGYPLAYVAAKLSLNQNLHQLRNSVTRTTTACFEPSLDYCVVKVPRWDLSKFPQVSQKIGSAMKSVGEVMAISRSFEEALQKALRMANEVTHGFEPHLVDLSDDDLHNPTYKRIYGLATRLANGQSVEELHQLTRIDRWFLYKMERIIQTGQSLELSESSIRQAKQLGFSDAGIAKIAGSTELAVRHFRLEKSIQPVLKQIDTVAGEFPCYTNYLYLTYNATHHDIHLSSTTTSTQHTNSSQTTPRKPAVVVLGSGVYRIGSSVEFDWCAVSCVRQLRAMGETTVMINYNPETVSTDYDEVDRLYFDEISFERVMDIYQMENPKGVVIAMGGQIPNNIAMPLHRQKVRIIGTSPEMIDGAENRYKFSRMLDQIGVDQPQWRELTTLEDTSTAVAEIGYPVLVRPSYVLSGAAMNVAYSEEDLHQFLQNAADVSRDHPVVVSKFIENAKEIEADAVAERGQVRCLAISEHVENAGVHSGDATLVLPAQDLTPTTQSRVKAIVSKIAQALQIHGPFNIQFIAKDDAIKVIECNLRVSRSFPFVSKVMDHNFAEVATRIMMDQYDHTTHPQPPPPTIIGVKVPQFSFNRLQNADTRLGVEMMSTGEVACFGTNRWSAYLKGLLATNFPMKSLIDASWRDHFLNDIAAWQGKSFYDSRNHKKCCSVLVSIGSYGAKADFLKSMEDMEEMNSLWNVVFNFYGTRGTTDYYTEHNIPITGMVKRDILERIRSKEFDLIINIPMTHTGGYHGTLGYEIRRTAVDFNVPIITDIKCAKFFAKAITDVDNFLEATSVNLETDCKTMYPTIRLPGLVDMHVHVREPGDTHKEDWSTCTAAALAGGITTIAAMPNTKPAIMDKSALTEVEQLSKNSARCDYMIYTGASETNFDTFDLESTKTTSGMKMYLDSTYGDLKLADTTVWTQHLKAKSALATDDFKPLIAVHAESRTLGSMLFLARPYTNVRLHVCHVARREEIEMIRQAKADPAYANRLTCEVAPHHLFLTAPTKHDYQNDLQHYEEVAALSAVCPALGTSTDVEALWQNMDIIDCFATDHAPHLLSEKLEKFTPGFPGLETALPLLLTAVHQGRLTIDDIILRCHTNPLKILQITAPPNTWIEVDPNYEWTLPERMPQTRAGWNPFEGMKVYGRVQRVTLRNKTVYIDGKVLAEPGNGRNRGHDKSSFQRETSNSQNIPPQAPPLPSNTLTPTTTTTPTNYTTTLQNYKAIKPKTPGVITTTHFTRDNLRALFALVQSLKQTPSDSVSQLLQNKTVSLLFYEASTRTRVSFATAAKRLGAHVNEIATSTSSTQKGETLSDTIKCLECYSDAIVLRSSHVGDATLAQASTSIPVISAGDGTGEHPTQALLDLYTIREERGTINGLTITMLGDLKRSRTVHSLAKILTNYRVKLRYVADDQYQMPQEIQDWVQANSDNVQEFYSVADLESLMVDTDVLYVTRPQSERQKSKRFNPASQIKYIPPPEPSFYQVTPALLTHAKPNLVIMHPLPRNTEISTEVDSDPRAAYFRQMENGLWVRAAILASLLTN